MKEKKKKDKKLKEENVAADGGLAALKGHLNPAKPPMICTDNPTSGFPEPQTWLLSSFPAAVMFVSQAHCLITVSFHSYDAFLQSETSVECYDYV